MKNKKLNIYKINGLNVEERLKELGYKDLYIRKQTIKYHYLITVILNKYFYYSTSQNNGYVKVYAGLMQDEIGKAVDIDGESKNIVYTIRKHLSQWGVIDYYNTIKGEEKDIKNCEVHYRINDNWLSKGYKIIPQNEAVKKLKKNIDKQRLKEKYKEKTEQKERCLEGIYKHLKKIYLKIELDTVRAHERLNKALKEAEELSCIRKGKKVIKRTMNKGTASYYRMCIDRFNSDKFFHVDYNTGRVYSGLTNLPKLLRPFLTIEGEPFVELDISNSQPLILSLVYRKWCEYNCLGIQKDGDEYQLLCETGNFYNNFKDYIKTNQVPVADTFKTDVFTRIFFNEDFAKLNSYQKLFKKRFPSVFECISDIKKPNYKAVSEKLQKYEADLIINKIGNRLIEEGIINFYTIHDAIAVTRNNAVKVLEIMNEEFTKIGLRPTIKKK